MATKMMFRLDVDGRTPSPAVVVRADDLEEGRRVATRYFGTAFHRRIVESGGAFVVRFDRKAA